MGRSIERVLERYLPLFMPLFTAILLYNPQAKLLKDVIIGSKRGRRRNWGDTQKGLLMIKAGETAHFIVDNTHLALTEIKPMLPEHNGGMTIDIKIGAQDTTNIAFPAGTIVEVGNTGLIAQHVPEKIK